MPLSGSQKSEVRSQKSELPTAPQAGQKSEVLFSGRGQKVQIRGLDPEKLSQGLTSLPDSITNFLLLPSPAFSKAAPCLKTRKFVPHSFEKRYITYFHLLELVQS